MRLSYFTSICFLLHKLDSQDIKSDKSNHTTSFKIGKWMNHIHPSIHATYALWGGLDGPTMERAWGWISSRVTFDQAKCHPENVHPSRAGYCACVPWERRCGSSCSYGVGTPQSPHLSRLFYQSINRSPTSFVHLLLLLAPTIISSPFTS